MGLLMRGTPQKLVLRKQYVVYFNNYYKEKNSKSFTFIYAYLYKQVICIYFNIRHKNKYRQMCVIDGTFYTSSQFLV